LYCSSAAKNTGGNIWRLINSVNPPLGWRCWPRYGQEGQTSTIIDAAALQLTIPEIVDQIDPSADFVGITATTPEISSAMTLARTSATDCLKPEIILAAHIRLFFIGNSSKIISAIWRCAARRGGDHETGPKHTFASYSQPDLEKYAGQDHCKSGGGKLCGSGQPAFSRL
jgi:hypothetical protein